MLLVELKLNVLRLMLDEIALAELEALLLLVLTDELLQLLLLVLPTLLLLALLELSYWLVSPRLSITGINGASMHTPLLFALVRHLQACTCETMDATPPVAFLLLPSVARKFVFAVSSVWTLLKSTS